jgi:parvulin-like peptidyl-prolyl isomerase
MHLKTHGVKQSQNRSVKRGLAAGVLLIPLVGWLASRNGTGPSTISAAELRSQPPVTFVAASINGEKIAFGDVNRQLDQITRDQPYLLDAKPENQAALKQIRGEVLNQLIRFHLMAQEARRQKIWASAAEVEKGMKAEQGQLSRAAFEAKLARYGETVPGMRVLIEDQVRVDKLVTRWVAGVTVTEPELKAFYSENPKYFAVPATANASHIVFKVEPNSTPAQQAAVRARALSVLHQAQRPGADFAALARQYSEDGTRVRGGALGTFHPGEMVKPFSDAVFSPAAHSGQVLPTLIRSDYGFHIIRIWDKKPVGTIPYSQTRERIRQFVLHNKRATVVAQRQAALWKAAQIRKYL